MMELQSQTAVVSEQTERTQIQRNNIPVYITEARPIIQSPIQQLTLKQLRRHFDAIKRPLHKGIGWTELLAGATVSAIVDAAIQWRVLKAELQALIVYAVIIIILLCLCIIAIIKTKASGDIEYADYCLDEIEADIERLYFEANLEDNPK